MSSQTIFFLPVPIYSLSDGKVKEAKGLAICSSLLGLLGLLTLESYVFPAFLWEAWCDDCCDKGASGWGEKGKGKGKGVFGSGGEASLRRD